MPAHELDRILDGASSMAAPDRETWLSSPDYIRAISVGSAAVTFSGGIHETVEDTTQDDRYPTFMRLLQEKLKTAQATVEHDLE